MRGLLLFVLLALSGAASAADWPREGFVAADDWPARAEDRQAMS